MPARAIVAHTPSKDHRPGSNWSLDPIQVPTDLGEGDLLIEMAASGICHTDLLTTSRPDGAPGMPYPRVAGHEGSGYIKAIGPGVTKKDLAVGDPVLLSFDFCGTCESCVRDHPAYCRDFRPLNLAGAEKVFQAEDGGEVAGKFFGQSSFASLSVVKEASVLDAKQFVQSREDLQLLAPLGCGIQTGAGAVLNVAKPGKDDRVMVLGLGGVGLSAIMAANISGCSQIIAVDRVQSRIELAKSVGATHGINTSKLSKEEYLETFKAATGGLGPTCVIDTTAFMPLLEAGYLSLAPRGTCVFVGASTTPLEYKLTVEVTEHMLAGKRLLGCCEGDSVPIEFLPRLIKAWRDGSLPLEKICKLYKADEFQTAVHDMHTGETIKPIIVW